MKNKSLIMTIAILIIVMSSVAQVTGTFTDSRDGKTYKTVKIGTQTWMAENLAYKSINGCWAYDNNQSNVITYGYLYNGEIAINICPSGWHLPNEDEWATLINYLGGAKIAGGKLKEKGTTHWASPNSGATDESGFTALPGGSGNGSNEHFVTINTIGQWWCSTESEGDLMIFSMVYSGGFVNDYYFEKRNCFSVRCVRNK